MSKNQQPKFGVTKAMSGIDAMEDDINSRFSRIFFGPLSLSVNLTITKYLVGWRTLHSRVLLPFENVNLMALHSRGTGNTLLPNFTGLKDSLELSISMV